MFLDNSRSEQQAGINVSYENSFSVIKRDIMKETIDKKGINKPPKLAIRIQFESIEERPSTMNSAVRSSVISKSGVKPSTSLTLKPSKDGHTAMSEYLGKPSPTNQNSAKIANFSGHSAAAMLRPKT